MAFRPYKLFLFPARIWAVFPVVGCAVGIGGMVRVSFAQPATSVQLPTFSYFSVGTSVLVPDRGGAILGGVGRSASQRSQLGWPVLSLGQKSLGLNRSAQIVGISVWIHDFEAMEAQLLGQRHPAVAGSFATDFHAKSNGSGSRETTTVLADLPTVRILPKPDAFSPESGQMPSTAEQSVLSVAELRRQRQAELEAQNQQAYAWFQRGQQAQSEGKLAVARIYYQMALRLASGSLKQEIQHCMDAVSSSQTPPPLGWQGKNR
ncbi:MAG: hypothetical protein NZ602_07105 [Thermoguttaceae bacterium]|nr:hypothetical protein [Thermoguttaceae bacterium]MDW8037900.1 hypothetical protein [Thermoguttaceae bacterium]